MKIRKHFNKLFTKKFILWSIFNVPTLKKKLKRIIVANCTTEENNGWGEYLPNRPSV